MENMISCLRSITRYPARFFFAVGIFCVFSFEGVLGGQGTVALPKPPSGDEICEIMFEKRDAFGNNSEDAVFTRKELMKFFSRGKFYKDPREFEKTVDISPETNEKGGVIMASGYFATKSGNIFGWTRLNKHILRIFDVRKRSGFLILRDGVSSGNPSE